MTEHEMEEPFVATRTMPSAIVVAVALLRTLESRAAP
jgi:hypothetical protein